MRVDTTVVETNVRYPTDSGLLSDGLRVLTRTMRTIEQVSSVAGEKLRDRMRSVGRLVMRIGRSVRSEQGAAKRRELYGKLLAIGGRVAAQARRFVRQIATGVKRPSAARGKAALGQLSRRLDEMIVRVEQVRRQAKRRIFDGDAMYHRPLEAAALQTDPQSPRIAV